MYEKNIEINLNVLKCCHRYNVQKVISCLSTCIFPDNTTYPINESMLHLGLPHYSNDAYAYSKRMLEIHSKAYQTQFGKDFICVIPTNIYGPNDNFSLKNGHVIPALIHNCYLSKKNMKEFTVKGTGKPLRQFIYSEDLAILLMIILEKYNKKESIILSPTEEYSIHEIAQEISECFNYKEIVFDNSFSDEQYRKTADNSKLLKLIGNDFEFTNIKVGIKKTVDWFKNNYSTVIK